MFVAVTWVSYRWVAGTHAVEGGTFSGQELFSYVLGKSLV